MTTDWHGERSRMRRRALVLLAVYALFVILPAAHLLLHDHGDRLAPVGSAEGATYLAAACGDGCEHPLHHHGDHAADEACAVCQTMGSAKGLPQLAAPASVAVAPRGRLASIDYRLRKAPEMRVALARGPPHTVVPRFEMMIA